jgi:hypothetical protein
MAHPNRNLVLNPAATTSSSRQLRHQEGAVHQIEQFIAYFNATMANLPLDHGRKTPDRLNENESIIFARLFRLTHECEALHMDRSNERLL